jgi:hypothetical protein
MPGCWTSESVLRKWIRLHRNVVSSPPIVNGAMSSGLPHSYDVAINRHVASALEPIVMVMGGVKLHCHDPKAELSNWRSRICDLESKGY